MNNYSVATNWAIFGAVAIGGVYYYWPRDQRRGDRNREDAQHAARRRRTEQEARGRQQRRPSTERDIESVHGESSATEKVPQAGSEATRKRKAQTKEPAQAAPAVVVQADEPKEVDMNTKQWAQQMLQARKGADLTSTKNKEQRVKTVKQSSAVNTPVLSSGSSQADDDASPARTPDINAGDVSDMLEPVPAGPTIMRVTSPSKPQKEKGARQSKEEVVETKKQRQNRQRAEERRLQHEADEEARKALEEKQRRAAREARGEPAKNGMQTSKPPANNAWTAKTGAAVNGKSTNATNANHTAPLLDTFDVESNSSSNGGPEASTAATSTSSAQWASEEEQLAQAMRQSEDESGWTTVAQPKKQKKKTPVAETVASEPVLTNKTNILPAKPTTNGKPIGFHALDAEYEQRADADPSDASNWDA